jgi:excisionase family DNA binding protein
MNTELLTRKEAAAYLGVKEHSLAVWACTKRYPLPFVRIGRLVKYRKSDLDAFIVRNTVASEPA